jgi:RNA polymerase sigma-70 factor (ECF subfamily)
MDPRIAKGAAGDLDALSSLLMEEYDHLHAFLAAKISPRYQAVVTPEDVLQQVFAQVCREISAVSLNSDEAFASWLTAIAHHRLLDAIDREKAQKRGGGLRRMPGEVAGASGSLIDLLDAIDSGESTPSVKLSRCERLTALEAQLKRLDPRFREAISLRYLEGLGRQEIADRLNLSADQVRKLLERALKKLRDALGDSPL